ncbi:MAG: SseB family protein [Planctomycetes bacterium]|nr:SseB family protein [Planctomycetota bacterium]
MAWNFGDRKPKPPEDNAALIAAYAAAMVDGDSPKRRALYEELLQCRLRVPAAGPPEGDNLRLLTVTNDRGEKGLPVFTDEREFHKLSREGIGLVVMDAKAVFEMAVAAGMSAVIIDPEGMGWAIERTQMQDLAAGRIPRNTSLPLNIISSASEGILPVSPPPARMLLFKLRQAAEAREPIRGCYLFMRRVDEGDPRLFLGFDIDQSGIPAVQGLMAEINETVSQEELGDVNIMPLDPETLEEVRRRGTVVFERTNPRVLY